MRNSGLKFIAFGVFSFSVLAVACGAGKICCLVVEDNEQDRPSGACGGCPCRPHSGSCEVMNEAGGHDTVNHYAEKRFPLGFIGCVTDPDSCCSRINEFVNCAYHQTYGDIFDNETEDPVCNTVVCEIEYSETYTCSDEPCGG